MVRIGYDDEEEDEEDSDWQFYESAKRSIPATANYDQQIMRIVEVLDL